MDCKAMKHYPGCKDFGGYFMYGAIYGDIIGSRFEFDRGDQSKDFTLFDGANNMFTDDTVMTVAVAEALMDAGEEASVEEIRTACIGRMQEWGNLYPGAGYGVRFSTWLEDLDPKPYNSFGNGSAMRVSAAGWLYDTIERTREVARATAEVTHNHPEGIKGAECTAAVIFLARTGKSKEQIREYVVREFGYDVSETVEQIQARHKHDESCMDSMPKALVAFFAGTSYEDVVRNAVSMGGDTDTIGAIAGSMGEAFHGIPIEIVAQGNKYLTDDVAAVLNRFNAVLEKKRGDRRANDDKIRHVEDMKSKLDDNGYIKWSVYQIFETKQQDALFALLNVLMKRMSDGGTAPAPMNNPSGNTEEAEMLTLTDEKGKKWLPFFTDVEELTKGHFVGEHQEVPIKEIMEKGLKDKEIEGIVINPFSRPFAMPKSLLKVLMDRFNGR